MLEKPYDLAVMFGLFALIVATVGFAVADINDYTDNDHNTSYFTTVTDRVYSESGFAGMKDTSAESITGEEGTGEAATQEGFLLKGFNSLLALGQSWAIMWDSMNEAVQEFHIDPIYIMVLAGLLVLSLATVIYSYIRGFG